MITFADLMFVATKIVGNSIANVVLANGYTFDVVRNTTKRIYKIKGYDTENNQKLYIDDYFLGFENHPIFTSRETMITFINEIELLVPREDEDNWEPNLGRENNDLYEKEEL